MVEIKLISESLKDKILSPLGGDNNNHQVEVTTNDNQIYDVDQQLPQIGSGKQLDADQEESTINLELVAQLRQMLTDQVNQDWAKFATGHYHEIMDSESPQTCWRYIEHCGENLELALQLVLSALIWRKDNKLDELSNTELAKEFWFYAPLMICGQTRSGSDVIYVVGKNYRKPDASFKLIIRKYVCHILLSWDRKHRKDLSKFCMVFDVTDTGIQNIDLDFMRWLISIRDFLPARFRQIHVVGIPLLVRPLINLIINWLPENFKNITQCGSFDQLVSQHIDENNLPPEVGGAERLELHRLAPVDSPWLNELAEFDSEQMRKAIEHSIAFNVSGQRREKLLASQLEYENKIISTS